MPRSVSAALIAALLVSAAGASAQTVPPDLRLATLEELMRIEVTSASRREQRVEDVPAAAYVIGRDEIHRSGLTSIPELLRLAPGVQFAWAAVSRALRTPSLIDRGLHVEYPATPSNLSVSDGLGAALSGQSPELLASAPLPLIIGAMGNPDFDTEHLVNAEAGHRLNAGSVASLDVVGFAGRYSHLQTYEPQAPVVEIVDGVPHLKVLTRYENVLRADTRGVEVSGRVQLGDGWQLDGACSAFHLTPYPNGSRDPSVVNYKGHAPSQQWRAHVAFPVLKRGQADLHLFRTGSIAGFDVAAYTRLDTRIEWSLTGQVSAVMTGQNLLAASHGEFHGYETNIQSTLVPRSAGLRLVWRF